MKWQIITPHTLQVAFYTTHHEIFLPTPQLKLIIIRTKILGWNIFKLLIFIIHTQWNNHLIISLSLRKKKVGMLISFFSCVMLPINFQISKSHNMWFKSNGVQTKTLYQEDYKNKEMARNTFYFFACLQAYANAQYICVYLNSVKILLATKKICVG